MGYVTDTTYANTFFRELSPAWLNYAAALNGVAPPSLSTAFRYLELGCGFGTSSIINAAAYPEGRFDAYDLNVTHIDGGRALAGRLGVDNIALHAASFDTLLGSHLDPYDFIVMHGVYSWVDAATRDVLRRLVARLLRPGGLLYVSYNTLPGWSVELPLRRLLVELAEGDAGTAGEKADRAATQIEALRSSGARYFSANPGAAAAVGSYTRGEGRYLAHEFMNAAWEPFYAVDVAQEFEAIRLQPAGSATLANNHLALIVDAPVAEAIGRLTTARQQTLAIDFAVNQRFRRDVFVREGAGARRPEHLEQIVIGCPGDAGAIGLSARVPRGEIRFHETFVHDVRQLFTRGSWPFGEAVARLASRQHDPTAIARNLLFMVAGGVLAPFARQQEAPSTPPTRLASATIERAVGETGSADRCILPSPVYGNGVELDADTVAALRAWSSGSAAPSDSLSARLPTLSRLGLVA